MTYVLDSWAVLQWLEGMEPAAGRVEAVMAGRPVMSWINLGEVYYIAIRSVDEETAKGVLADLRSRVMADVATPERVLAAARIKAVHPMALGDAFAVAAGLEHDAVILTGDPEIIETAGDWQVEDLR